MIFERTKAGEIRALARLLNVTEEELLNDKILRWYQPDIKSLDELSDDGYGHLIWALTYHARLKAHGDSERIGDIYEDKAEDEDEDDDEEEDEETFRERWARMTPYEQKIWRWEQTADIRCDDMRGT